MGRPCCVRIEVDDNNGYAIEGLDLGRWKPQ